MSHLSGHWHPSLSAMVAHAQPILTQYGYVGIFLANLAEGIGIPLPGQTLLMAGALLALDGQYDITTVVMTALCASFLGACIGFCLGRLGGRAILAHAPVNQEHLARIEQLFRRYGVLVILLSRFLDGFRQLTPIIAGSLEMRAVPFLLASLAGSALWVGVWGLGIYWLGPDFHHLLIQLKHLSPYSWLLATLVICALSIWLILRRRTSSS